MSEATLLDASGIVGRMKSIQPGIPGWSKHPYLVTHDGHQFMVATNGHWMLAVPGDVGADAPPRALSVYQAAREATVATAAGISFGNLWRFAFGGLDDCPVCGHGGDKSGGHRSAVLLGDVIGRLQLSNLLSVLGDKDADEEVQVELLDWPSQTSRAYRFIGSDWFAVLMGMSPGEKPNVTFDDHSTWELRK